MIGGAGRAVVGVIFLVSGTLKLRQPAWPATAKAFGAPAPVARALPLVEIVLGALLVVQIGVPWVPLVALVLLLVFTAAIAAQVARGKQVPCACFGELSAKPVSGITVVRNGVLCALTLAGVLLR